MSWDTGKLYCDQRLKKNYKQEIAVTSKTMQLIKTFYLNKHVLSKVDATLLSMQWSGVEWC